MNVEKRKPLLNSLYEIMCGLENRIEKKKMKKILSPFFKASIAAAIPTSFTLIVGMYYIYTSIATSIAIVS